ncbi:hypothetical protein [Bacillus sp. JJ1474]|uniref:hypothetical protein n=1 Tax=Bacillus sp. JJ1474 TaxID=3122955 RepID=UPI002FFE010B
MFGLSPKQYFLFLSIHVKHLKSMGSELQKKYCLSKVKDVVWDKQEDCLKVYYDDTWWHYDKSGRWY